MKIVLLAISVFGALMAEPSFAKDVHPHGHLHRAHRADGTSPASATVHGHAGNAAADTRESEPTAVPVAGSSRSGVTTDKGRGVNTTLKTSAPGARHTPVVGPPSPPARNAIGLPVTQHENPMRSGGFATSGKVPGAAFGVQTAPHPVKNASVLNTGASGRGGIGGGAVIRPSLAVAGLGGPAKAVTGINGTTVRLKR